MKKEETAVEYFRSRFNCSQAVLVVFGTDYGLSENDCLKIGCGFGGGMGRQQLTCGAVTGAVMALGLKYGKGSGDPEEKKTRTYIKTRELFSEFCKINGSSVCKELLNGLDMNDPEDHKKIMELGLFETLCEKYVADAVKITGKLIQ